MVAIIVLYSTGCPKCKILKSKLDEKKIEYEICTDTELMLSKGFKSVPILQIDNNNLSFNEAIKWVLSNG